MFVSVIVPTLNNKTLVGVLEALERQSRPADEVIVVGLDENGITADFPNVTFLNTMVPVAAAVARNKGMAAAKGDIFLFIDSDCIPSEEWVAKHVAFHEEGQTIVAGGVDISSPKYLVLSDNLSMFHEYSDFARPGHRQLLPTLNLSIRREVWEKVGGMDESFPGAAGEDSDWTIRIKKAGYDLVFSSTPTVLHAPERNGWKPIFKHWYRSGYNNIRVRIRHAEYFETPAWVRKSFLLRLFSPVIATVATARIFSKTTELKLLSTLPVVWLTKLIYCWGAAKSIDTGFAFE